MVSRPSKPIQEKDVPGPRRTDFFTDKSKLNWDRELEEMDAFFKAHPLVLEERTSNSRLRRLPENEATSFEDLSYPRNSSYLSKVFQSPTRSGPDVDQRDSSKKYTTPHDLSAPAIRAVIHLGSASRLRGRAETQVTWPEAQISLGANAQSRGSGWIDWLEASPTPDFVRRSIEETGVFNDTGIYMITAPRFVPDSVSSFHGRERVRDNGINMVTAPRLIPDPTSSIHGRNQVRDTGMNINTSPTPVPKPLPSIYRQDRFRDIGYNMITVPRSVTEPMPSFNKRCNSIIQPRSHRLSGHEYSIGDVQRYPRYVSTNVHAHQPEEQPDRLSRSPLAAAFLQNDTSNAKAYTSANVLARQLEERSDRLGRSPSPVEFQREITSNATVFTSTNVLAHQSEKQPGRLGWSPSPVMFQRNHTSNSTTPASTNVLIQQVKQLGCFSPPPPVEFRKRYSRTDAFLSSDAFRRQYYKPSDMLQYSKNIFVRQLQEQSDGVLI
jgi:hypothetical protein